MATKSQKLLIALLVTMAVGGAVFAAYMGVRTFSHVGEDAVTQMSAVEREWLARLDRLHRGMPAEEVYRLLGEPSTDVLVAAQWNGFGGSRLSRLRIYFANGRPHRLR